MRSGADGDKCDVSVRERLPLKILVECTDEVSSVLTAKKNVCCLLLCHLDVLTFTTQNDVFAEFDSFLRVHLVCLRMIL